MNKIVFLPTMAICMIACNNSSAPANNNDITTSVNKPSDADTTVKKDIALVQDSVAVSGDTIIKQPIIYDTVSAKSLPVERLHEKLTDNSQSIHLLLEDVHQGKLNITIAHSQPKANIRISQIIMPDGNSDGPFGRELKLKAKQKGNYTIIINKSNMASGSQVGDVFITITK